MAANDPRENYRQELYACLRDSNKSYDQAVLALSGGAIGLSITFCKELIQKGHDIDSLWRAWFCWGFSVFVTLLSFYSSQLALTSAVKDWNAGKTPELTGWDLLTRLLNPISGVLFLVGFYFFMLFATTSTPKI